MAHQAVAAAPSRPPLSPDGGRRYVPTAPQPRSALRVCCLETLVQQGASGTDRHRLTTRVAVFFPLTPSPVVQLPSAGTQLLLGKQPLRARKQECIWQKSFSSPSTLFTGFLPPICSSLPPSQPLCFLHMLAQPTSILFLTSTYTSLSNNTDLQSKLLATKHQKNGAHPPLVPTHP